MDTDTYTDRIRQFCTAFKLPTVGTEAVPRFQQAGHGEALETLLEVLELEAEDRQQRRTTRLRRASRLAPGKTWDTFQHQRLPARLQQQLGELAQGEFIEQGTNVLAFGLPGTGKTHALCALGHRLVETGYSVLFTPAYRALRAAGHWNNLKPGLLPVGPDLPEPPWPSPRVAGSPAGPAVAQGTAQAR